MTLMTISVPVLKDSLRLCWSPGLDAFTAATVWKLHTDRLSQSKSFRSDSKTCSKDLGVQSEQLIIHWQVLSVRSPPLLICQGQDLTPRRPSCQSEGWVKEQVLSPQDVNFSSDGRELNRWTSLKLTCPTKMPPFPPPLQMRRNVCDQHFMAITFHLR